MASVSDERPCKRDGHDVFGLVIIQRFDDARQNIGRLQPRLLARLSRFALTAATFGLCRGFRGRFFRRVSCLLGRFLRRVSMQGSFRVRIQILRWQALQGAKRPYHGGNCALQQACPWFGFIANCGGTELIARSVDHRQARKAACPSTQSRAGRSAGQTVRGCRLQQGHHTARAQNDGDGTRFKISCQRFQRRKLARLSLSHKPNELHLRKRRCSFVSVSMV